MARLIYKSKVVYFQYFYGRVGIIGTNFFIAIIDKILEIIAILSVIGDNFRERRITIVEEIFIVDITCTLISPAPIALLLQLSITK